MTASRPIDRSHRTYVARTSLRGARRPSDGARPHAGAGKIDELEPFSSDSHFSISPRTAPGYRSQTIDQVAVIGANGQIVALEHPGLLGRARRHPGVMLVPVIDSPARREPIRFLWSLSRSMVGLDEATGPEVHAVRSHEAFKKLHSRILDGVGDIALQAFLRFLEHMPTATEDLAPLRGRPGAKLAFRFQYDEHFLHERHAAQLAWKRFLADHAHAAGPRHDEGDTA